MKKNKSEEIIYDWEWEIIQFQFIINHYLRIQKLKLDEKITMDQVSEFTKDSYHMLGQNVPLTFNQEASKQMGSIKHFFSHKAQFKRKGQIAKTMKKFERLYLSEQNKVLQNQKEIIEEKINELKKN